ncbi:biotin/lipoyl-containing protein [Rathayibacter toxicus]|uniref:biotin/lipoyl-containing protein n=2 Tax=Rathayibacter toxicus TaxID=145458 RepID=UPI000CE82DC0|nr:biotin/lipoyl-containing protein [Rathayibacter toxicus]PPI55013.1 dihydrolipoamide acetyltransferase [Rathayibacter toxicus]QOD09738.1 E3 binding domain-containing protein [Rathayibacter toxicus]QWL28401.1 dihydrolipoamide acetyltransferase [Rathayibacter toxicus]QWL32591.1 dihydrolipoamide acetyltransferase [Rathayibacter toxicus]QWL34686.1 dihydrolipoamide acetyltransferase [Rathayibacter toxicus]
MSMSELREPDIPSLFTFHLPDPGEGLTSAELSEWAVVEGQDVGVDQLLLIVETAKAAVEIPSPISGTIVRLIGIPGEIVPVGGALLEMEADDADAPSAFHLLGRRPVTTTGAPARRLPPKPAGATPKVTPTVRRLARALSVSLRDVTGTGPGGSVTATDIESVASHIRRTT